MSAGSSTNLRASPALARVVGWISLEAIALNGMIGAGIFALPSTVTQILGPASPIAYLVAGLAIILIALCFAELGSLFDTSGGPYLYAHAAFGSFVGFEVGWMFVLARLTSLAAVSNTFSAYLGYFWPALSRGSGRVLTVTLVIVLLSTIHCLGVRPGVALINALTIGKLVPLLVFCSAGLFFIHRGSFSMFVHPSFGSLQQASLLLIFALGGFEFVSVPSGEVISVRRTLPPVLISAVLLVATLYLVIQIVAMGTLPNLSVSKTPLASAAANFLGPAGATLLTLGAIFSTTGTSSATVLVGSRMLYSLAEGGYLPGALVRVNDRYKTPVVAIVCFTIVAVGFAVSGTFAQLAGISALARLLFYTISCIAVPVLRRKMPAGEDRFTLPAGPLIPICALIVCIWLMAGSPFNQMGIAAVSLVVGAILYAAVNKKRARVSPAVG